jgi:hypothetical protein
MNLAILNIKTHKDSHKNIQQRYIYAYFYKISLNNRKVSGRNRKFARFLIQTDYVNN